MVLKAGKRVMVCNKQFQTKRALQQREFPIRKSCTNHPRCCYWILMILHQQTVDLALSLNNWFIMRTTKPKCQLTMMNKPVRWEFSLLLMLKPTTQRVLQQVLKIQQNSSNCLLMLNSSLPQRVLFLQSIWKRSTVLIMIKRRKPTVMRTRIRKRTRSLNSPKLNQLKIKRISQRQTVFMAVQYHICNHQLVVILNHVKTTLLRVPTPLV